MACYSFGGSPFTLTPIILLIDILAYCKTYINYYNIKYPSVL